MVRILFFLPTDDLSIQTPNGHDDCLVCPKRPKWKYYMTKKEVEKVRSIFRNSLIPGLLQGIIQDFVFADLLHTE